MSSSHQSDLEQLECHQLNGLFCPHHPSPFCSQDPRITKEQERAQCWSRQGGRSNNCCSSARPAVEGTALGRNRVRTGANLTSSCLSHALFSWGHNLWRDVQDYKHLKVSGYLIGITEAGGKYWHLDLLLIFLICYYIIIIVYVAPSKCIRPLHQTRGQITATRGSLA